MIDRCTSLKYTIVTRVSEIYSVTNKCHFVARDLHIDVSVVNLSANSYDSSQVTVSVLLILIVH